MAKGKNAAALFEVINKNRQDGKVALRTPAWWKNKARSTAAPEVHPAATNGASPSSAAPSPAPAPAPSSGFHLTTTSMMLAGAGIIIGFVLAILFTAKSDRPKLSPQTTDELRAGPANPQVMEVKRGEAGLTPLQPKTGGKTEVPVVTAPNSATPVPTPAFDGKRTVGLNYVIIQSYPEQKQAEEARDVLAKAGISTTIEKGLRGLNPNWFIVVGTDGFARIRSTEYETYVKHVQQVSDSYTNSKKKSFKAFEPMGYKWDRTDR